MVDHPAQLPSIVAIYTNTSIAPQIFLKIDMGGHRAGVAPQTSGMHKTIGSIIQLESKAQQIS